MRLRRGPQAVDGIGGDLDGGVEPEGHLRTRQVVVDGLRNTDGTDPVFAEALRHSQGVLSTHRHEGIHVAIGQIGADTVRAHPPP